MVDEKNDCVVRPSTPAFHGYSKEHLSTPHLHLHPCPHPHPYAVELPGVCRRHDDLRRLRNPRAKAEPTKARARALRQREAPRGGAGTGGSETEKVKRRRSNMMASTTTAVAIRVRLRKKTRLFGALVFPVVVGRNTAVPLSLCGWYYWSCKLKQLPIPPPVMFLLITCFVVFVLSRVILAAQFYHGCPGGRGGGDLNAVDRRDRETYVGAATEHRSSELSL